MGPEGTGTLDVRATLETDDGALIYNFYRGRMDLTQPVGGAPIYATPLYETGDERYAWINKIEAVANGKTDRPGSRVRDLRAALTAAITRRGGKPPRA